MTSEHDRPRCPDCGRPPADAEGLARELAEALRDWNRIPSPYAMLTRSQRLAVAEALAPFVVAHTRRAIGRELRTAADNPYPVARSRRGLLARANVLDPCDCPDTHCGECGCCPDEEAR